MIAKAMGPQNTVGAMGIMPSTVETAVSMIGRKRVALASSAASQTLLPAARSASIWPTRMTAFLVMMPMSASTPSSATKPSGLPDSSKAPTTPMRPSGAMLSTTKSRSKLCNCTISTVSMMNSISGTTAMTEACDFALSSTVPPVAMS